MAREVSDGSRSRAGAGVRVGPEQGLVENTRHTERLAKACRLTPGGERVIDAHLSLKQARRETAKGGTLVPVKSARRGKHHKLPGADTDLPSTTFRLTALTHQVLTAIADLKEQGHSPSNRRVAQLTAVKDEGQISKLLTRLEHHRLLENTATPGRSANAWRLTPRGEELLHASHVRVKEAQ